jgi:hypothetical protein
MPHKTSVPLKWRLRKSRYGMIGTRCEHCNISYFPPRMVCPSCNSELKKIPFSGKGTIESFTIVHIPLVGFETQVPYAVGIIRLEEGTKITGQIVDNIRNIEIGKKVEVVFRKLSEPPVNEIIPYGFKFRLSEN